MKKGYLVLENGCVLSGHTNSISNVLGIAKFNGSAGVSLTGNENFYFKPDYEPKNFPQNVMGKIVIDDMPLEYHIYDVKTQISE